MPTLDDQLAKFKLEMQDYGLKPPRDFKCDARIYRCDVQGHGGESDGAYFLANFGGYLTGWYHNWQIGDAPVLFTPDTTTLSPQEKLALQEQIDLGNQLADDERREREIEARGRLTEFMTTCSNSAPYDHPYFKAKKIGNMPGVKSGTWKRGNRELFNWLIIPIYDEKGKLLSCQGIGPDGEKLLFYGAPLKGGRFLLGNPNLSKVVIVTESYSNAYSLHKALSIPVVVTFGTKRLLEVCISLRNQYPEHKIVIAADNDYAKYKNDVLQPNEGILRANQVAATVHEVCVVAAPEEEGHDSTDWNDHSNCNGYGSVRSYFSEFIGQYQKRLFYSDELEPSAPEWLIQGILEKDSLGCMFGPSGVGKSFIAVELACCVASGTNFMGDIPVKEGMVVYVVGEGYRGFTRRRYVWKEHRNKDANLHKLIVSKGSFQLLDGNEMVGLTEEIDLYCQELGDTPALIIVDTLARNFGDGDENSTQDMSSFVNTVDRSLREKYNCCVLVVHHTGHDKTRARGNGALRAALDTELSVARDEDNEGIIILKATKTKDGSVPDPIKIAFEVQTIEGLIDNFGQTVGSATIRKANPLELCGNFHLDIGGGYNRDRIRAELPLSMEEFNHRYGAHADHFWATMTSEGLIGLRDDMVVSLKDGLPVILG